MLLLLALCPEVCLWWPKSGSQEAPSQQPKMKEARIQEHGNAEVLNDVAEGEAVIDRDIRLLRSWHAQHGGPPSKRGEEVNEKHLYIILSNMRTRTRWGAELPAEEVEQLPPWALDRSWLSTHKNAEDLQTCEAIYKEFCAWRLKNSDGMPPRDTPLCEKLRFVKRKWFDLPQSLQRKFEAHDGWRNPKLCRHLWV